MPTRVLVAARLSRVNAQGDQGRIDRDDADAQSWAEHRQDVEIVAVSVDAGVSGSVSPFKRRSLGPWLTDPHLIVQYDEIVASTLDRLGRNARDLQGLRNWCEDNGKTLRVLKPELTWPLPEGVAGATGRVMWELLGALAQIEREFTKERYGANRAELIGKGAFIGKPPWGYIVTGPKFNKSLAFDPALVAYLRGMVDRAMRGETFLTIGRWLDSEGVQPKKGGKWSPSSVRVVLTNPALMGRRYDNGKVVHRFDSLLTAQEFKALQDNFDNRPSKRGPSPSTTAMLTGILKCDKCGGPMYRHNSKTKRVDGTYSEYIVYRCNGTDQRPSTCRNSILLDTVHDGVDFHFSEDTMYSSVEIVETVTVPGDDHADEIAEIEADLKDLDYDTPDFLERQATLLSERARLIALPAEPAQVIERPTGKTMGEVWPGLNDAQKRRFLLAAGVTMTAAKDENGRITMATTENPRRIVGTLSYITEEHIPAGLKRPEPVEYWRESDKIPTTWKPWDTPLSERSGASEGS